MNIKDINKQLKQLTEHAWKNACGVELTQELAIKLKQENPKLPDLKQTSINDKISWLIKYIDNTEKDKLIGIKISNIGSISYIENAQRITQEIILSIGDTDKNNNVKLNSTHGLYHMKYGLNNHWSESKQALYLIPRSLKNGKIRTRTSPYKYEIIYKDKKTNKLYIIGVPSIYGDETVLISCY